MKNSIKAALLSGLVFPGLGQLAIRQYLRAAVFALLAGWALWMTTSIAVDRAMLVVDRIYSGDVAPDAASVQQAITDAGADSGNNMASIAMTVLFVCWIVGIVDAYRQGAALDRHAAAAAGTESAGN
ncbi:MAG: hypothetical protein KDI09_08660 [Halioglobus sp.]|nr:hypothetical protein [Halioglobus sp.]